VSRTTSILSQVELFPAMNPLGLDTLQRLVPVYETDLNRKFPGHAQGLLPQRIAHAVLEVTSPARPLFHAPSRASGVLHLS
jgi:predicted deacylase